VRARPLLVAAAAFALLAGGIAYAQPPSGIVRPTDERGMSPLELGAQLFAGNCASCHGVTGQGVRRPAPVRGAGQIAGQGPPLRGVGAAAADFYLSTGRMPLDSPTDQPERSDPAYPRRDIDALIAFIGSFGGPAIPRLDASGGSVKRGLKVFTERCAGCHQVLARGGIVTGGAVPALDKTTVTQLAEAVRIGPYLMPKFGARQVDARTLADLAAYMKYARDPQDAGGWGIGHIGPIPEGMVAWLLAALALVGVARIIGERAA
jgi:ubiquinol-cytochrome c reductase cytochrome c subunit